jgi:hypothetical protein
VSWDNGVTRMVKPSRIPGGSKGSMGVRVFSVARILVSVEVERCLVLACDGADLLFANAHQGWMCEDWVTLT